MLGGTKARGRHSEDGYGDVGDDPLVTRQTSVEKYLSSWAQSS